MILLEDVFRVEKLDPDGKKFDKGEDSISPPSSSSSPISPPVAVP